MPNSIELFKQYIDQIDEVYATSSVTAALDGANDLVQQGANAGEFLIPKMDMDGLADYKRNAGGYAQGSVSIEYETHKANYDRARRFDVNDMDNQETAGIAFGKLSAEFIRTKVAPEIDAFRFASYAAKGTKVAAALADGGAWIKALSAASTAMDDADVPMNDRLLFITSTGVSAVNDMDTTKSRAALERFAGVVTVPAPRFYSVIDLQDGRTSGEEKGGFKVDSTSGKAINFQIISRSAVIQFMKNIVNKVITPADNQEDDAWRFFYHAYGICDVYENKVAGIYTHTAA